MEGTGFSCAKSSGVARQPWLLASVSCKKTLLLAGHAPMARGRSTNAAGFRWTPGGSNDRGREGLNESHLGGNPGANLKSISHRCYHREVAFEWELTEETIYLSLGCLRGRVCVGEGSPRPSRRCGAGKQALLWWRDLGSGAGVCGCAPTPR